MLYIFFISTLYILQCIFCLKLILVLCFQMDLKNQEEKFCSGQLSDAESLPDIQQQSSDSEEDNFEQEIHINTDEAEIDSAVSSDDDFFVLRRGHGQRLVIDMLKPSSITQMDAGHDHSRTAEVSFSNPSTEPEQLVRQKQTQMVHKTS